MPARLNRWACPTERAGQCAFTRGQYTGEYPPQKSVTEEGIQEEKEPTQNVVTWVYEEGSFVPCGKFIEDKQYSIITDYLGTPTHAYSKEGKLVWERELDVYGAVRKEKGDKGLVPQLYQGQYEDAETGLYYNRFRYYSPKEGMYVSQDPIGLAGNNPTLYGYVFDPNTEVDVFGLDCKAAPKGKKINRTVYRYSPKHRLSTTWDAHAGNIGASHRYTKKGVGGVYGANSPKTAMAEITHWNVDPSEVVLTGKKVSLKNVLDLTDPKVREQLGVELSDITGDNYDVTHNLGDFAVKNGYDGILAPSARNPTGTNLIGFAGL